MLLKFSEACKELQIKPSTLYQWVSAGLVPVIRVGRVLRFDREALINWFKAGEFLRAKRELLKNRSGGANG